MTTGITTAGFIRSRVGGLPRPFWVLFGGTLVNRLGTMVEPFIGIYLTQARGMPLTVTGLVMTVFGVGALFSQPVAGWLTDRVGRRATLTGGMVATAVTMLAVGYMTSTVGIVTAMFVLGVAIDAYRPASQALVADLVPPEDRPRAYGLLFWAVNLGYSIAMVMGGWLARSGFTLLFWIDAVTCLIFGLLVWRAVPETRRPAPEGKEAGGFGDVLRDRVMVAFALTCLMFYVVYAQSYTTLPLAMTGQGLPPSSYGVAMAVNGILIVLIQPFSTDWFARFEPSRVLAAGYALAAAGFMLTAVMSTTAGHAAAVAVWTLGEILTAGIPGTIVAALAPAHLRGRYSGLYGLSWSAAGLIAPLIGTRLLAIGPEVLWPVMGGLAMLAAAVQLSLTRAIRARRAA